jgi:hypothetical protein
VLLLLLWLLLLGLSLAGLLYRQLQQLLLELLLV